MPYDFRYVPTSGDLSGTSLEKQTEKAINEIGVIAENAVDSSNNAEQIANNAVSLAENAVSTSQQANNTAQEARSIANQANGTAQQALNAVQSAQDRADSAYDLAANAQTAAASAQTAAANAQTAAVSAQTTAANAQTAAASAQETANSALVIARTATDIYEVVDDTINLDGYFASAVKLYLTNAAIVGLPVSAPAFFNVVLTNGRAVQKIFNPANPAIIYTRSAVVTYGAGGTTTAEWGDWSEIGGGSGGSAIVGEIRLLSFRATELPSGWYFCNGDQYALTSAQGAVLNTLSANFKADWGIAVSGANISIPNLFYTDGRGFYLRAVNGTARQVGSVEDDQIRPITGSGGRFLAGGGWIGTTGAFSSTLSSIAGAGSSASSFYGLNLNTALLGNNFSGVDTHPIDKGMTPAMFLGV